MIPFSLFFSTEGLNEARQQRDRGVCRDRRGHFGLAGGAYRESEVVILWRANRDGLRERCMRAGHKIPCIFDTAGVFPLDIALTC